MASAHPTTLPEPQVTVHQFGREREPVVQIDDATVGTGTPGPIAKRLREIYIDESLKKAI